MTTDLIMRVNVRTTTTTRFDPISWGSVRLAARSTSAPNPVLGSFFQESTSITQNIRTKAAFATSVFASLNHAQITRAENIKNNDASRLPGVYI